MAVKRPLLLLIILAVSVLAVTALASAAGDEHNSHRKRVAARKHRRQATTTLDGKKIDYRRRFFARNNDNRHQATPLDGEKIIAARKRYADYRKTHVADRKNRAATALNRPKIDYEKLIAARKNWANPLNGPKIGHQKRTIASRKHLSSSKDASHKAPKTAKRTVVKLSADEIRKRMAITSRNRALKKGKSIDGFKFVPTYEVGAKKPELAIAEGPAIPFPLPPVPSPFGLPFPLPPFPSPLASERP